MRKYDEKLVNEIANLEYYEKVNGINILMKPVPDDLRKNAFDPRIIEIIERKKQLFKSRSSDGFRLSNERNRPDKVTYDLTKSKINESEYLVPIDNTHLINTYVFNPFTETKSLPVIVYLHGGGMTSGDVSLYKNQMKLIAEKANAVIVFPEYRLSPECPYPGPVNDASGVIKWVSENKEVLNINPDQLILVGDSAGASLSNACILRDKNQLVKKLIEIYPAVDFSDYRDQDRYSWSFDHYPVIDEHYEYMVSRINRIKKNIETDDKNNLYLQGKTSSKNPEVSIVFANDESLSKFPPTTIVSAEYDFLRVGSDYFAEKLSSLGVEVTSVCYKGCDHGFFDMLGTVVQSESLCNLIADEVIQFKNR